MPELGNPGSAVRQQLGQRHPRMGQHQPLGHPSARANTTREQRSHEQEIHDLPWDTQGTMCFPPFLFGSLGRSQARCWWCFLFLGAVHVLGEERAGFQGWGDGCAMAPTDLEQHCASMGVTDL